MGEEKKIELLRMAVEIVISMRESETRLEICSKNTNFPESVLEKEKRIGEDCRRKWNEWFCRYGEFFKPQTKEEIEHLAFLKRAENLIYALKSYERAVEIFVPEDAWVWDKDILEGGLDSARRDWVDFCRFLTAEEKEEFEKYGEEEVKKHPSLSEELASPTLDDEEEEEKLFEEI